MPQADVYLWHANGSLEQVVFRVSEGYSSASAIDVVQPAFGEATSKDESLPWFFPWD